MRLWSSVFNENQDTSFRCRDLTSIYYCGNEARENYLCFLMSFSVFENLPKLTYSYICFGKKAHSLPLSLFARLCFFIIFRKGLLDKTKSNSEAENNFTFKVQSYITRKSHI